MLKKIVAIKIYFDRARVYIGYWNTFMIVVLLVNALEWEVSIAEYIILFAIFFILSIFIGWLDTRLKIRKYEFENQGNENPILSETLKIVKELRDENNKLKKSKAED